MVEASDRALMQTLLSMPYELLDPKINK